MNIRQKTMSGSSQFAVIFNAKVKQFDPQYSQMATKMRDLALHDYGCLKFIAVAEDGQEIAISYWQNESDIAAWKQNVDHLGAQALGRSKWYPSYKVEIVKIVRSYTS
ncbi:MAG: heme-degrading monooxygenase HmoA [Cryomorphaceae bacterium]|jgi:heme-degrading monooxygenase HmoA